jgi:asparagine synthase (glutamine-hydrolysing)
VKAEIDPVSLDQIFTYWSTLSPRTAFQHILEVPPGHYLIAREGNVQVERYWEVDFPPDRPERIQASGDERRNLDDYLDEFRSLLVDATRIRLRADVPVGAYLSGGLDSSTTAAIIRNYTNNRLDTFSISFNDPDFDESVYQYQMAKLLCTDHHVVHATYEEIGQVFPVVIWHTETPILRTSPSPLFLLSRLVREQNYKVVMTGEGADEFLAGYNIFKEALIRRFWARRPESKIRPLLLRRIYPYIGDLTKSGDAYLAAFFGEGLGEVDAPHYSHLIRWRNTTRTKRFFNDELRQVIAGYNSLQYPVSYPTDFMDWHPLHRAQFLEITIFLSQYLLSSQGDRVSMANSVEGRPPFLDHRLVEFSNQLPPEYKLRGLTEKFLLKKLACQWLPDEIWQRPKRPYRAPIHRSFINPVTEGYVKELLSQEAIQSVGFFKPLAVQQLVDKAQHGAHLSETDDMALVGVISSQLVYNQFVKEYRLKPPLSKADDLKVYDRRKLTIGARE